MRSPITVKFPLSLFLKKMVAKGLISGFDVEGPGGREVVSHLLFADDSLIFVELQKRN